MIEADAPAARSVADALAELERLAARSLPPPSTLLTELTMAIADLVVESAELRGMLTERQLAALDMRRRLSWLLKYLERNRMDADVAEICARFGISKATYYRLLASLTAVRQIPDTLASRR